MSFDRFTDRAQKVAQGSSDIARTWRHEEIGTEHLLLALAAEVVGVAAVTLDGADVTPNRTQAVFAEVLGQRAADGQASPSDLPQNQLGRIAILHLALLALREEGAYQRSTPDKPMAALLANRLTAVGTELDALLGAIEAQNAPK